MTTLREAAQQALEVMSDISSFERWSEVRDALKAALAEHFCDTHCTWADHAPGCVRAEPVQEPVAWTTMPDDEDWLFISGRSDPNGKLEGKWYPLYTAPPQRKPLTDEEIGAAANSVRWSEQYHIKFARAIEKAHGIGSEHPATLSKPCGSLGEDVSLCRYPDCVGGQAGTICHNWCPGCR